MLNKDNRLTSKFEFNITRKYGVKHTGVFSTVYSLKPTNYEGPIKVGIVVSNRVHPKAAKRNYVKRVLREIVRKKITESGEEKLKNLWIVVQSKQEIIGKKYEEIRVDIDKTLQKIFITD